MTVINACRTSQNPALSLILLLHNTCILKCIHSGVFSKSSVFSGPSRHVAGGAERRNNVSDLLDFMTSAEQISLLGACQTARFETHKTQNQPTSDSDATLEICQNVSGSGRGHVV